jgi:hypothetical protein
MDALRRAANPLPLRDLVCAHAAGNIPDKAVAVTPSRRELHAELSFALEGNQTLTSEVQQLRERQEKVSIELQMERKLTDDLETALHSRVAEVTSLSARATDAIMQLHLLKASTSWKLTRPFRRCSDKFPWTTQQLSRWYKKSRQVNGRHDQWGIFKRHFREALLRYLFLNSKFK